MVRRRSERTRRTPEWRYRELAYAWEPDPPLWSRPLQWCRRALRRWRRR